MAAALENIIYLELCRRGYSVHVGKIGDMEIDLVAQRRNERLYVQLAHRTDPPRTEERAYDSLFRIRDDYPRYILTTDSFAGGDHEGIRTMHIADFLLSGEF